MPITLPITLPLTPLQILLSRVYVSSWPKNVGILPLNKPWIPNTCDMAPEEVPSEHAPAGYTWERVRVVEHTPFLQESPCPSSTCS